MPADSVLSWVVLTVLVTVIMFAFCGKAIEEKQQRYADTELNWRD